MREGLSSLMFMLHRDGFQVLEKNVPGLKTSESFVDLYMSPRGERKNLQAQVLKKKISEERLGLSVRKQTI